jgi:phosphopantothenoylcysteine decarboxylase / phosphopantothenate---cysteine ligase
MTELKNVIVGISGGIAAYKIPMLIRLFRKNHIDVKVVCTQNALRFVTPLTLETLSENTVYSDTFQDNEEYSTAHISITDKADAMIIAPATANIIAKCAAGIADDALSTTFLSFNKQVFIAPAMNTKMWEHQSTQQNIQTLKKRGVIFIEPEKGFLACGYEGKGRMAEPDHIFSSVLDDYNSNTLLKGKKVLVTAGPTHEPIDPVRFIGNRSSGKMGFALAEAFAGAGASVTLVTGPVGLQPEHPDINVIQVQTAKEMLDACQRFFSKSDMTIMAAAVADFSPEKKSSSKIKKANQPLILSLKPTIDILETLGKQKKKKQLLVGFALETDNELSNARKKLQNKNLDCIVLNSLNDPDSGFEFDTNKITIITKNETKEFPLKSKKDAAKDILDFIAHNLIHQ